ncbi:MAG: RT0821/Lpp0805 family surface protein [Candidatus Rickettsia vulgarisii]
MKSIAKLTTIILASTMLQSCSGDMNKQGAGTFLGSATGAILGAQFGKGEGRIVGAGLGAVAGALIGSQIGKQLDENDKRLLSQTSQRALESSASGHSVEWRNPDSGHHGYITPTNTYRNNSGEYCREYTQTVNIGGRQQRAYGTACRQPDGHWKIIK